MAYPIKFLSLQKLELTYEVEIRGVVPADSVQELRRQIVKISCDLPSEDILESPLDPKKDIDGAKESLSKACINIGQLTTNYDKNLFLRTENLLNHLYHRINRITVTEDLTEVFKEVNGHFKSFYKTLLSFKPPTQHTSTPLPAVTQTETIITPTSVTCERNLLSDIEKIKYSGKTCVRAFIQKVEEFATTRGLDNDKLMSFMYEIFTEDALHWYRCMKNSIKTWDELVQLLKQDFSSNDYDYRLLSEICAHTQGDGENITIYLAIMHGMFSQLDKSMSEDDKLEIILHNIRPCYTSTLASATEINNVNQLKTLCRNYENFQSRMAQFHEPP